MTPRKPSQRILAGPVLRTQPDQRLVVLAREGHESALEEIVRRHRPGLVRYAASIVPPDRADDVVQDSLARSLPEIGGGEDDLRLRPWLYTIVRNAALNQLRDAGPPHEQLDENYDGVEQPPQAMERRERMRSLVAGLRGLPEAQRKALVKREMEGRSHAEIGAEMGVSTGAARQLIFRARHALRASLGSLQRRRRGGGSGRRNRRRQSSHRSGCGRCRRHGRRGDPAWRSSERRAGDRRPRRRRTGGDHAARHGVQERSGLARSRRSQGRTKAWCAGEGRSPQGRKPLGPQRFPASDHERAPCWRRPASQ